MSDPKHPSRDKELDALLSPLRIQTLQPEQVRAWIQAAQSASRAARPKWFRLRLVSLPQLATAALFGFAIGAAVFGWNADSDQAMAENPEPSATVEHIYAKAE